MAFDYTALQSKASELITRFGTSVVITYTASDGTDWVRKYDEAKQRWYWEGSEGEIVTSPPSGAEKTATGVAVVSDWPKRLLSDSRNDDTQGGIIQVEDVRLLIVSDLLVVNGYKVTLPSGRTYDVVPPVKAVAPNGTDVLVQEVNARG